MNAPSRPTARQLQVLRFVQAHRTRTGKSPSFRRIADELGLVSTSTTWKHVQALRKKGALPEVTRERDER